MVLPTTTEQVARVVRLAHAARIPMVTRGSGTGLSGGSVPSPDALVICLAQMDAILEVDPENLTLRAQAGAVTMKIDEAAGRHGLLYPPDPGSMQISTIGGNVAENSGGLRGLKYGVTRDYVMGLEVVLVDGDHRAIRQQVREGRGGIFDEGSLHRLRRHARHHHGGAAQARPEARRHAGRCSPLYDSIETAAETVSAIIAARIIPCTLEFLDRMTIDLRGGLRKDRAPHRLRGGAADGDRWASGRR